MNTKNLRLPQSRRRVRLWVLLVALWVGLVIETISLDLTQAVVFVPIKTTLSAYLGEVSGMALAPVLVAWVTAWLTETAREPRVFHEVLHPSIWIALFYTSAAAGYKTESSESSATYDGALYGTLMFVFVLTIVVGIVSTLLAWTASPVDKVRP